MSYTAFIIYWTKRKCGALGANAGGAKQAADLITGQINACMHGEKQ